MKELRYPSEEDLQKIREWPAEDIDGLMEFIKPLWEFGELGYFKSDRLVYYLSTAGWSGNEEIIGALRENTMFWMLYWFQSQRGGHYVFCPATLEGIKQLEEENAK